MESLKLDDPTDVAVDSDGTLWIADRNNNRVLGFSNAAGLGNTTPQADRFFGEPSLNSNTSLIGAQGLDFPVSVQVERRSRSCRG